MSNPFDEVCAAIDAAEATNRACNDNAYRMAKLLRGRLRNVSHGDLVALKKELQDFNMHTGRWK